MTDLTYFARQSCASYSGVVSTGPERTNRANFIYLFIYFEAAAVSS